MSEGTPLTITLVAASGETFGVDDISNACATRFGFWEHEGLDVTWMPRRGGMAAMTAVLDGEADVAYAALGSVLRLRSLGSPCRIIVSMARSLAQNLVVGDGIDDPMQLEGKRWAVDGLRALSHDMARMLLDALGIDESTVHWEPVGPPPERIKALLSGAVDASLIRTEEAISLSRTDGDRVHTLLGFHELKELVPLQVHGVLATTEAYEANHAEELHRLTRGMILASRAMQDDFEIFKSTVRHHVAVPVTDDEVKMIWEREVQSGGWAINGEMTRGHWQAEIDQYFRMNPELRVVDRDEILAPDFVEEALNRIGIYEAGFDQPGT